MSSDDVDASGFEDNDDTDDAFCNLSIVAANVRPVNVSASLLASCCSSLSEAQNSGTPSRRKSLPTVTKLHTKNTKDSKNKTADNFTQQNF